MFNFMVGGGFGGVVSCGGFMGGGGGLGGVVNVGGSMLLDSGGGMGVAREERGT